ncbi:MAG: type II secretion system protein [Planctomycetes bacterium]|nr:type II secretion system protein [Planctomycetota bacterium]
MRSRARGFTLLELMAALMITVTVLVALQTVVGGAIMAAGDAITQREARERARMKLEEILAGVTPPSGGGSFEDAPQLKWTVSAEPVTVGLPEQGGQSQVRIVTLRLTYPTNAQGDEETDGSETITLAGILPIDEASQ